MKIQTILEKAKFSKEKTFAYHATSKKHLRSILKKGLIKNYSEEGLGNDLGDDSEFGFSYDPHDGVYLTTNYSKAVNFARDVGGNGPLIVVVQVQSKSTHLDEDELFSVLGGLAAEVKTRLRDIFGKYRTFHYTEKMDDDIEEAIRDVSEETLNNTRQQLNQKYGLSTTTVKNIINQAEPYIRNIIKKLIDGFIDGNTDIRHEQEKLMKLFKNIVRKNIGDFWKSTETFSVPYNIGFRGANKIVGIIDLNSKVAWGEQPQTGFPTINTPMELLKQS